MNIIIVDENDKQIGVKERGRLDPQTNIYRVVSLWLFDSDGNMLLAKRSQHKKAWPGLWSCAVAGTVEEGETYQQAIVRETEEELGVIGIRPTIEIKRFHAAPNPHFTQRFHAVYDLPVEEFHPDPAEIEELRWWTEDELQKAIADTPEIFTPVFVGHVTDFFSQKSIP